MTIKIATLYPARPAETAPTFARMAKEADREPRADRPAALPATQIVEEPALFQPRHDGIAYAPGRSEAHIAKLAKQPRSGHPLDPVSVVAFGSTFYLVDGHHRIKAYQAAGWSKDIPVEVLASDLSGAERVEWAIGLSCADNGKERLPLDDRDKCTKAWQATARGGDGSKEDLAQRYHVSTSTIATMRKTKRLLEEAGENPEHCATWDQARRRVRELQGGQAGQGEDDWDAKQLQRLARRLQPVMEMKPSPRQLLQALEAYDPYIITRLEYALAERREEANVEI